jgi:hypothetical protein
MVPARLRCVCGKRVAGILFFDIFVATAGPWSRSEAATGGTGTLREMAVVCAYCFMD